MSETDSAKSGWVRYRITDRSGTGWETDHWIYSPWLSDESENEDDARGYIVRNWESWAIHAERYSFQLWRNEMPPASEIEKAIKTAKNKASAYREEARMLTEQLLSVKP